MGTNFHIEEKFDGPLDLLLAMIQKSEINIYDIPIGEITDQFLEYIHHAEEIGLGDLSEFYKMAADLIYIKSAMMLPVKIEFEEEYVDPREELVERLLEYSKFKKYSELLINTGNIENFTAQRKESQFIMPFSDQDLFENVSVNTLFQEYTRLMRELNDTVGEKTFNIYEEVTENEKFALMNEMFEKKESIKFSDLFVKKTPLNIICSFLAVLEAVKNKIILVSQDVLFGEIILKKRPQDYRPESADDYDKEYDEIVENKLEDNDDFSVLKDEEKTNESK